MTTWLSGELLVRYLVRNDTENLSLNGILIPPLQPPLEQIQNAIDDYLSRVNTSPFIYDENMGWINQPNHISQDQSILINDNAIRSSNDFTTTQPPDTLRIALFGDSFTFGAGVSNDETLDYFLEESLNELGIRAEVLNFGVPAYGPDQAYLSWQYMGINYQPDIAILSYSTRMSGRALNIFRVINSPETRLPFSKPRFHLDNDTLQIVNSPTVRLEDIPTIFQNFEIHPLREYEFYYDDRYTPTWWRQSKFLAYVSESISNTISNYISDDSPELVNINRAIIEAFAQEAEAEGTNFMLGHLPTKKNLSDSERSFQYYNLLLTQSEQHPFLDANDVLSVIDRQNGWLDDGHYARAGNQIVADDFAMKIVQCIESNICQLPRFEAEQSYRIQ